MAKVARAWAPFFGIVGPAAWALASGLVVLAAKAGLAFPAADAASNAMSPGAAAGIPLVALGLIAAYRETPRARAQRLACATLVLLVVLTQLIPVALGLEHALRTPPATLIALVLCTPLMVFFDRPRGRLGALLVQAAVGLLLAIGLVGIIANEVNLQGLVPGYHWSRMSELTAVNFIAIAASSLALVARTRWYETVYAGREDEKILVLVLGILSLTAIAMGAASFVAIQRNLDRSLKDSLANAVDDRAAILENVLTNRVTRASIVATRPTVVAALASTGTDPRAIREPLLAEADSLVQAGFTGVAFDDPSGQRVAAVGRLTTQAPLEVPVRGERAPAEMIWTGDAFLLRVRTPIRDGTRQVGTAVTEQALELLLRFQFDKPEIGESAEWELCAAADEQRMACFPRRFARRPALLERRPDGESSPMDYALAGGTGVLVVRDEEGEHVVAGFTPVSGTGLGVALRMRQEELYAPLRHDLVLSWRWYFAVALAAALLVASQVRPVAQRLVTSERMAQERSEALTRSESALRELYASLADGIIVLGAEGTIEFANPAAEQMFGYGPGELARQAVATLIPEELREANARDTRRFVEEGTSNLVGRRNLVFPALRRDGERFDLEFSLAPMRQGDAHRLVAVLRDVSQRTALERMKSEFTATVSHELRTPLTSLMGSLELLREDSPPGAAGSEMLEMAWRNSQRLALLVNDVIDQARIESGALRFEPAPFDLAQFLDDAVQLDVAYAAMHHATLRLEAPAPEARVFADRDRLLQVMANLVSNAAKFSAEGGEVTVGARVRSGRVRIAVSDRGRGIPEEFRARIFQPFSQADSSDERERGGTGLGLAICKAIVERSGGAIGFEDREGGGTTFWFEVPTA